MAEEKKEPWLNYLALTTVLLAVCATLATFKGGGYSTRSVMAQSQASDQWAYFQAKGVKEYLYSLQKEKLELELQSLPKSGAPVVKTAYELRIAEYGGKLEKYRGEKAEIEKLARDLEKTRDDAQLHSKAFGMAVIFLQISILLCSISGLMKKKPLWYAGMAGGALGMVFFANGFWLFF